MRDTFTLDRHRTFDHDPRFGLVVLSEIASRALSPAVNDPGTAIGVLDAGTRVLAQVLRDIPGDTPPACVRVPPVAFSDLLDDLYRPIMRDGASMVEVAIRLQKSLATLAAITPRAGPDCRRAAKAALERALDALSAQSDCEWLNAVHDAVWGPKGRG